MQNYKVCNQKRALPPSALQTAFETAFNIWTVRFTFPRLFEDEYTEAITKLFKDIDSKKQVKYSMTFKEYSKKQVLHFHMRIVTSYKTPAMLRKYLKEYFPASAKGNKFFSCHKCWIDGILYDKSLCHSSNYIAKEAHIVHFKNYSKSQIKEIIAQSLQYNAMLKMPLHEKIIQLYDIKSSDKIASSIMMFYDSIDKIPPKTHIIQEVIRKILFTISHQYRMHYRKELQNYITEITCYN